ncbi:MAG: hypothetical protein EB127_27775, partial [Alphaproteobacteria bacterium]|nr:hypothetical protein [Alphaproteobacteria bacterium]
AVPTSLLGGMTRTIGNTEQKGCELGVLSYFGMMDRYDAENILEVEEAYHLAFSFETIIKYLNTMHGVPVKQVKYIVETEDQVKTFLLMLHTSLKNGEHTIAMMHRRPDELDHAVIFAKHNNSDPQLAGRDLPGTNSQSVRLSWRINDAKFNSLFSAWQGTHFLRISLPAHVGDVQLPVSRFNCRSLPVDPLRYRRSCDQRVLNLYRGLVEEKDNTDCPEEARSKSRKLDFYERLCRDQVAAVDSIINFDTTPHYHFAHYIDPQGVSQAYRQFDFPITIRGQNYTMTEDYMTVLNFDPDVGMTIISPAYLYTSSIAPLVIPPDPLGEISLFLFQKDFNTFLTCSNYQHNQIDNCAVIAFHDCGFLSKIQAERLNGALRANDLVRQQAFRVNVPRRGTNYDEMWAVFRSIFDINEYPYIFNVRFDSEQNFRTHILNDDEHFY